MATPPQMLPGVGSRVKTGSRIDELGEAVLSGGDPNQSPRDLPGDYAMSTTGSPSTSILGETPSPGSVPAAMRPLCRCGAPSALLTLT